ncbi:hypothetical protein FVB9288_01805 [Flavobacterium sp. CECT 9288]|uniref:hypothetical protein n=1 Tax=Flavobacterium sp. CECT 9288 TaxID=2845819 RepID=UPI001E3D89B1|nr:hypothetical protein [Flavobacterium sp. CECT 9288]CAH0336131.1 hypothetical protein FVB9288_01805 [Flavobacterium sp. CECT 9288]
MNNDKVIENIKEELKVVFFHSYEDIKSQLEKDFDTFFEISKSKLERCMILFSTGDITKEELEWLLKSQLDIVVLKTLQANGLSKIRLNTIKKNIVKIILKVIMDVIIPRTK